MDPSTTSHERSQDNSELATREATLAQQSITRAQIEDLLDFSLTERVIDRRVSLIARVDLACS